MSEKPAVSPATPAKEEGLSESFLMYVIAAIFLIACALAWWLVQAKAVPGAPGAPIG